MIVVPKYNESGTDECILILRNSTEAELNKKKLSQQIQFHSQLIKRLPIGIYMFDIYDDDIQLTLWNPKMTSYFGYREEDVLDSSIDQVFDPETVKRHKRAINQIVETGLYYDFPGEYIKTHSGMRYFHTILTPMANENKNYNSFLGIMDDVSEKIMNDIKLKRYQKEIVRSLETKSRQLDDTTAEISSILDNSYGMSIFSLDDQFCYRVFNAHHKFLIQTQYDIEIEKGMSFLQILNLSPDMKDEVVSNLKKSLLGINTSTTLQYLRPNGNRAFLDAVFSPLYSQDKIVGVTLIFIDITSRRLVEKEAEIFKTVADVADYGVMLTDLDLNIHYSNAYWEKLLNILPGSIESRNFGDFLSDDHRLEMRNTISSLNKDFRSRQLELDLNKSDSSSVFILMNCLLFDEFDGSQGIAFTCLDITPMKEASDALVVARDAAERASIMKSTFVANMSHEIRTPLNAVLGFADLMKGRLEDPELTNYLQNILRSGGILKELINDILDFSKIEAGKMNFNPVPTQTISFFYEIYSIFSLQVDEKKLILEFSSIESLPNVLSFDPQRIRQILINLIGNSMKFTKWGYIKLLVKYDDEKKILKLSVSDTGIGIPVKDQKAIFNPFEQQEKQDARNFEGTGLGLSIIRKLISIMKGKIQLKSDVWKGSSFAVQIPMDDASSTGRELLRLNDRKENLPILQCYIEDHLFSEKLGDQGKKVNLHFVPLSKAGNIDDSLSVPFIFLLTDHPENFTRFRTLNIIKSIKDDDLAGQNYSDKASFVAEEIQDSKKAAIVRSIMLQKQAEFKESGFSLDSVDGEHLPLIESALDSRDFSDISQIIPLFSQCDSEGQAFAGKLQDAVSTFNIMRLNELLEILQLKLNERRQIHE